MSEKKVLHEYVSDSGTVRVRQTSGGNVVIDSYNGDVKDPEGHDRLSVVISGGNGKPTGHGKNHEKLK